MTIYLVQHGQCFDKETDPDRKLSPIGRATITQVANMATEAGITVTKIYHSGKLRTQQTAEIFSKYLNVNPVESIEGIDPLDNVEDFANHLQLPEKTMIVGHLPFMERLTSYLITGRQDLTIVKFQNAGIVCLDQDENRNWYLKWTIMPVMN